MPIADSDAVFESIRQGSRSEADERMARIEAATAKDTADDSGRMLAGRVTTALATSGPTHDEDDYAGTADQSAHWVVRAEETRSAPDDDEDEDEDVLGWLR